MKVKLKNIKHFFYRIKRLLDWLPIIWDDCDFDYAFLLEILNFKLKKMHEWFSSDKPNVESAPVTAKEIKKVLEYLDRYFNKSYQEFEYAEFNLRYGLSNEDDFFVWQEKFQALPESAKQEWRNLGAQAETDMHNDLMQVFDLLKQNIEGWWD